jgi:hypothetical protein
MSCDVKRCGQEAEMVYLTICAEGHIDEYLMCIPHTLDVWAHDQSCRLLHPVVEHMAAMMNGHEPKEPKFFPGEWVAVKDGEVVKHGGSASDLYRDPEIRHLEGANIFRVEK